MRIDKTKILRNEAEVLGRIFQNKEPILAQRILDRPEIFDTVLMQTCHRIVKRLEIIKAIQVNESRQYTITPFGTILLMQFILKNSPKEGIKIEDIDFVSFFPNILRVWNKINPKSTFSKTGALRHALKSISLGDIVLDRIVVGIELSSLNGTEITHRSILELNTMNNIVDFIDYAFYFYYVSQLAFYKTQLKFKNNNMKKLLNQYINELEEPIKIILKDSEYSRIISEFERTIKQDVLDILSVIGQTKNPTKKKRGRAP